MDFSVFMLLVLSGFVLFLSPRLDWLIATNYGCVDNSCFEIASTFLVVKI